MAMVESIATLSIALAFAIPTFFDKVMRPEYTKKVNIYRKDLTDQVHTALEEALEDLRQDEEMSEATRDRLDELTDLWVDIRGKINKLDYLLNFRQFLVLLCITTLFTSIMSMYTNEYTNPIEFDWTNASFWLILIVLSLFSVWVYQIFDFDRELSRYPMEKEEVIRKKILVASKTEAVTKSADRIKELENRYLNLLDNSGIPIVKSPKVGRFFFDFAIPSMENPKLLVEVKLFEKRFSFSRTNRLILMGLRAKESYPDSKLILLTNTSEIRKKLVRELKGVYDKIFDIENPEEFLKYVKENLS